MAADIEIKRSHSLTQDEAKKRVEQMISTLPSDIPVSGSWKNSEEFELKGSGLASKVTGKIIVSSQDVRVEIGLPFTLKMMKGKIEGKLNEKLELLK